MMAESLHLRFYITDYKRHIMIKLIHKFLNKVYKFEKLIHNANYYGNERLKDIYIYM